MAKPIIGWTTPIEIKAAEGEGGTQPTFEVVAYTGGMMSIRGYGDPVVINLTGMSFGKSLVANLDHVSSQRVGHVTQRSKTDGKLTLGGVASASTPYRDEVVNSAKNGFVWQASVEAVPEKVDEIPAGKAVTVNGQEFTGPLYLVRKSTLKGFAFVSHGADDNTEVTIAAAAASSKGKTMKAECKAWVERMLPDLDLDTLSAEAVANLEADFEGRQQKPAKVKASSDPFESRKLEAKRRREVREIADRYLELRNSDEDEIVAVEKMHDHAIKAEMTVQDFRIELYESSLPVAHAPIRGRDRDTNPKVLAKVMEAAICKAGRLANHEKMFDDQTLQMAHDKFPNGIGLKQLFLLCAEFNGHRGGYSGDVTLDVHNAAFGMAGGQRQIQAQGWSTISISNILSNTANKYLMDGWNAIDMTPLEIAFVRSVRDFKEITTISLTGDLIYEKVGAAGEIKHGTLGEEVYGNKADTYARMLAITRQHIINDDIGALTSIPQKLGRGAANKLNDIFWREFLNPTTANFFSAGNANVNTGVANMTVGGLAATEAIFLAQTDPDGLPLGIEPKILVVPTALKTAALTLMNSQFLIDGTGTAVQGSANIWQGRFKVVTSPYLSNSAYTGFDAAAWYMLASPGDLPLIEIVALNGRVEPVVETADADFNVLGVQMRGYSDVGVRVQEPRAGVRADGGAS